MSAAIADRRYWRGVMVFPLIALSLAQDCGAPRGIVVQHFDLPTCAEGGLPLPDSASDSGYTIVAIRHPSAWPTFKIYIFSPMGRARQTFGVRLRRVGTCVVDVAYELYPEEERKYQNELGENSSRWAEVTARLVADRSNGSPVTPASAIDTFPRFGEFKDWSVRTSGDSGRSR